MSEITRPPIVTILGHVDHGKTTLLDFIRKSSVATREHGGITQHIGAYQIEVKSEGTRSSTVTPPGKGESGNITFIDTPGHAAFEKMRSRGARVADIAILVVAVDDGLMPQTVEAIKHILAARVSMIVAVNKVDLPGVDINVGLQKIKKQLSDNGVLVEEYGGDVPIINLSAKTGEGVDKLLEMITLVSEMNELKGDPDAKPSGVVIESNLDKFKGPIATILIRNGTLKKGDQIILNGVKGKIRGMFDYNGQSVDSAGPSTPVEVLGLDSVPSVGSTLGEETKDEKKSKEIQSLVSKMQEGETNILKVVIKADKQGSLEAIEDSLEKFNSEAPVVEIVGSGTGEVGEADIKLASSVRGIVLSFNTKIASTAAQLAEHEHVLIRSYTVIYELLEEVEEVVEGMIKPGIVEEILGKANIIAEFPFGKAERIAGCRVIEGGFSKSSKVRISREEVVVGESKLKSLRKVKEEVTRVEKGVDCGMIFDPPVDFQIGDIVESYRII